MPRPKCWVIVLAVVLVTTLLWSETVEAGGWWSRPTFGTHSLGAAVPDIPSAPENRTHSNDEFDVNIDDVETENGQMDQAHQEWLALTTQKLADRNILYVGPARFDPACPSKVLVFFHGGKVPPNAYLDIAQAIQDEFALLQSDQRVKELDRLNLFVVLPTTWIPDYPDPISAGHVVADVLSALSQVSNLPPFHPKTDVIVGGHSLGGIAARSTAESYAGLVLFASYLDKGSLSGYKVPVLTLGGERDLLTRMSRLAYMFRESESLPLNQQMWSPVVILPNVTHSQFCSATNISFIGLTDLDPVIPLSEAHELIASVTSIFLQQSFRRIGGGDVNERSHQPSSLFSRRLESQMDIFIRNSRHLLQGTLTATFSFMDSYLCGLTQINLLSSIHDSFEGVALTNEEFTSLSAFSISKPSYEKLDGSALGQIKTKSYSTMPTQIAGEYIRYQSPENLACKCKSAEFMARQWNDGASHGSVFCSDIQRSFLELSKSLLTSAQLIRYQQSAKRIMAVAPDTNCSSGLSWISSGIKYEEVPSNNGGPNTLWVSAAALYTSVEFPILPGMQYCKILPPSRIMEFMIGDAFAKSL